jgi:hypothetical protein
LKAPGFNPRTYEVKPRFHQKVSFFKFYWYRYTELCKRELGAPPTPQQLAQFEELDVNKYGKIPLNDFLQSVMVRAEPSLRLILDAFSGVKRFHP